MKHTHTWRRFVLFDNPSRISWTFKMFAEDDYRTPRPWYTGWQCSSCGAQGYAA